MSAPTPKPWAASGQRCIMAMRHGKPESIGEAFELLTAEDCFPGLRGGPEWEEAQANRALMVAAPDLLEACQKVLTMLSDWEDADNVLEETGILAAAIDKAEGRP